MGAYAEQHIALINQSTSEKDRLVLEKDEIIASKDRMWRELYAIIRERDAEILHLRCAMQQEELKAAHAARPASKEEENANLKTRNAELEQALRDLLDAQSDVCDDGASDPGQVGDDRTQAGMEGMQDDSDSDLCVTSGFAQSDTAVPLIARDHAETPRTFSPSRPPAATGEGTYLAGLTTSNSSMNTLSSQSPMMDTIRSRAAATFSFAPLIRTSAAGTREFGDFTGIAPLVHRSIQEQVSIHQQRRWTSRAFPPRS